MESTDAFSEEHTAMLSRVINDLLASGEMFSDRQKHADALGRISKAITELSLLPDEREENTDEQIERFANAAELARNAAGNALMATGGLVKAVNEYFSRVPREKITVHTARIISIFDVELAKREIGLSVVQPSNGSRSSPDIEESADNHEEAAANEFIPTVNVEECIGLYRYAVIHGAGLSKEDLHRGQTDIIKLAIKGLPPEHKNKPTVMLRLITALVSVGDDEVKRSMVIDKIMEVQQSKRS